MSVDPKNLPLTAESIYEAACQHCGSSQWSDYMMEGLSALVDSFNREANPSPEIVEDFRIYCITNAIKGISILHTLENVPDIVDKKITRPLFIIGMPRTGTTFLHYLLGDDPNGRALQGWETYTCPVPMPEPATYHNDPRIEAFRQGMEGFYEKIPEHRAAHHVQSDAPEECIGLFAIQLHAHVEFAKYNVPSYASWLVNRDMRPAYEFYKKELQCLSYHFPDGPHWILKAPFHLYFLDVLAEVFPDACFVQTHRDLRNVVPSGISLTHQLRSYYSPTEKDVLGKQILDSMSEMAHIGINHRKKLDPSRFLDVSYKELTRDPIGVTRHIYDTFGYEFTPSYLEQLNIRLKKSPKNKHGVHQYTLEEYGLSLQKVDEAFAIYNKTYAQYL